MNKFNFSALLITVAILVGFNHIQAAWSDPAAAPTGSNTAAPINVSNDGQIKTGPLGVGGLDVAGGVFMEGGSTNHLDFEFTNTADSAPSTWSVRRNDGTDDWLSYLNIQSATTNLLQSAGYAYRERYNPGAGNYLFQVSDNATAGAAGDTVGWKTAIAIGPDGSVTINDLNSSTGGPVTVEQSQCYGQGGSDFSSAGYFGYVCDDTAAQACGMVNNCGKGTAVVYGMNRCRWTCETFGGQQTFNSTEIWSAIAGDVSTTVKNQLDRNLVKNSSAARTAICSALHTGSTVVSAQTVTPDSNSLGQTTASSVMVLERTGGNWGATNSIYTTSSYQNVCTGTGRNSSCTLQNVSISNQHPLINTITCRW